ncbi:MAG: hypothetical protein MZV70_20430 [Desulfobacterales bacterium]|nr:hypothetical protein [Desulfobacterales bacterium]
MPEALELDVTELGIGDALHVNDIALPSGVELPPGGNYTVVTVVSPKAEAGAGRGRCRSGGGRGGREAGGGRRGRRISATPRQAGEPDRARLKPGGERARSAGVAMGMDGSTRRSGGAAAPGGRARQPGCEVRARPGTTSASRCWTGWPPEFAIDVVREKFDAVFGRGRIDAA